MKNILLILVGGTICTALNEEGNLAVDEKAGVLLVENYKQSNSPYASEVHIEPTENLYMLSESMTIAKWNRILETYRTHTANKKYDGIILAHGTDTLAYSAALFSMLLCDTDVPVFFVSANENLMSARSNGNENFACAVECICRGITPNVYVSYKNLSDGKMYLHLASRLRQCENYSEDFYSVGAVDLSEMTAEDYKQCFPKRDRKKGYDFLGKGNLEECVLFLVPYVGINYGSYDYKKFKAVLHGTFHSGTACVDEGEQSVLYMLDSCFRAKSPIDVYFSPTVYRSGTYETISFIGNHKVNGYKAHFMNGCTNEMAYVKLVIAYSMLNEEERKLFLESECNFENCYIE